MGFPYIRKVSAMDLIESGNILVFQDNFEGLFRWKQAKSATFTIGVTNTDNFSASNCVLITFDAGVALNDYAEISKYFSFFNFSKYQTRFYFTLKDPASTLSFTFGHEIYANNKAYALSFKYLVSSDKFQFLNSSGNYEDFPSPSVEIWHDKWQGISFDFDLVNMKYGTFHFGLHSFDLSNEGIYISSTGHRYAASLILFKVEAGATPSEDAYILLDNVSVFAI